MFDVLSKKESPQGMGGVGRPQNFLPRYKCDQLDTNAIIREHDSAV